MKFLSNVSFVVLALALAAAAPAKAQQSSVYHEVDTVVLQGSLIGSQAAGAVANAASTGTDVASKADAAANAVNIGNVGSLSTNINASSYQPNGNIASQVDSIVGQVSAVGSQSASTTANASAVAATTAASTAANIGNSVTQSAGITSLTSQH